MKSLLMNDRQRLWYGALSRGEAELHTSQFGEDVVINTRLRKQLGGFYVDIGAFHPFSLSNTALLHYERGWRGLNVDLDERAIRLFEQARPGDINLCCAVGREEGEMEAMTFDNATFNTLDPARQLRFADKLEGATRRIVRVRTLASLLAEHVPPDATFDFLNVDVEGLDHDVLAGNDWTRWRPRVIAVETHGFDPGKPGENAVFRLLTGQGYRLQSHVFVTSIYTRWGLRAGASTQPRGSAGRRAGRGATGRGCAHRAARRPAAASRRLGPRRPGAPRGLWRAAQAADPCRSGP
ncbi:FkbM family methyltransferase, partial [Falsiroseomonas oryziterrae]|uniref:FkbM family methyltransferase n=1 Tax=Falsiroseomonas oryziterrae TaxID=2911368 RepID=UPI001F3B6F27